MFYFTLLVHNDSLVIVLNHTTSMCSVFVCVCDQFWENQPKRGEQLFSVSLRVDFFQKKFLWQKWINICSSILWCSCKLWRALELTLWG